MIQKLFREGKKNRAFPLQLIHLPMKGGGLKMGVGVSKRKFPKAVDRNHLKRLIREAFRKNKPVSLNSGYALFVNFTGKKKISYQEVERKLISLLNNLR